MADFLQLVRERVVVYDGAMGTNIQVRQPTLDDFWGKENCSEVLVLSRPDIIRDIHAEFLQVGCDVVETNTFGGTRVVLGEFDLADRVHEINVAAAKLAKEIAQQFSTKEKPRFVAGSIGPTTKLPSLGHIKFDEMVAAYEEQAAALIEGGADILLVETAQDLLQAKIAAAGALEALRKAGKRLPVTVQVTLQESGTMLLGTEIGAALTALEPFDIDVVGFLHGVPYGAPWGHRGATHSLAFAIAVGVLVGLGIREISVTPVAIAGVKDSLSGIDSRRVQALAQKALEAGEASEVERLFRSG